MLAGDNGIPALADRGQRRSPIPIAIVTVLFVLAAFLTWYGTWFGHDLNDEDLSEYLSDKTNPTHVQHALLQIENRIEKHDAGVRKWYPQVAELRNSPEPEIRKTAAWVMGNDNGSVEFHSALVELLYDKEPIVRWNAAVQLARFNDDAGRPQIDEIFQPSIVASPAAGRITGEVEAGSRVREGALLARIVRSDNQSVEVRSPLPGKVERVFALEGGFVQLKSNLLSITPDEAFVYEALRALVLIGHRDDLARIRRYTTGGAGISPRTKLQASLTISAIESRP